MVNVFHTVTETRQCDGKIDDETYKAWIAEGFEFKYGKFIRQHKGVVTLEQLKKPVAGRKVA